MTYHRALSNSTSHALMNNRWSHLVSRVSVVLLLGLGGLVVGAMTTVSPGSIETENVRPCREDGCTFFRNLEDELVIACFAIDYSYNCDSIDQYNCSETRCPDEDE